MTGEGMGVLPGTGNPGLDQHISVFSLVLQVCAPFCVVRPPEKLRTKPWLHPSISLSLVLYLQNGDSAKDYLAVHRA